MDVRLVDLKFTEDLLNRFKSTTEEILAELFETGTSEGSVEVDALQERVDFDGCLRSGKIEGYRYSLLRDYVRSRNNNNDSME